jgi:hypothetical protein
MSDNYTKLFSSIIHSTIWQASNETKVCWVTMLAMADQHGRVMASLPGLAKAAGIETDECESALELFRSPDKYSRTPDFEGRRIMDIPGGWALLNHGFYRKKRSEDEIRNQTRERVRAFRARHLKDVTHSVTECNTVKHSVTENNAKAEAEAEAVKDSTPLPPTDVGEGQGQAEVKEEPPKKEAGKKPRKPKAVTRAPDAYAPEVLDWCVRMVYVWPKTRENSDEAHRHIRCEVAPFCDRVTEILAAKTATLEEMEAVAIKRITTGKMNQEPRYYFGKGKAGGTPPYLADVRLHRAIQNRKALFEQEPNLQGVQ